VLKRLIKAQQAHEVYLTKEQQLQGKDDWLVKDPKPWVAMCESWMFEEFKVILVRNW
jgi:hypothetical protein